MSRRFCQHSLLSLLRIQVTLILLVSNKVILKLGGFTDYRYGSHTVFNIEYHFVWVTEYRYRILHGDIALRLGELIRQTCDAFEIGIISGVVSKDHVHISVSAPPVTAPSGIMRRIRGRTSLKLSEEFPHLKKRYWGRHFPTPYLRKNKSRINKF